MAWPLSQDYNEAIQDPQSSLSDPELRGGSATTNALGMPMPRSGNFADVYEFIGASGAKWAIKCFTREVAGLQERYNQIDLHLLRAKLPFSVEFQYQPGGILIRGKWHPILKMQWVEGLLLNEFVRDNLDKPALLGQLGLIWSRVAKRLREEGIAHADLQHGNVLLVPGSKNTSLALKLIDYDGMFVPALAKTKSGEVGHPNYQHPQRLREGIYNAEVDRFPLLVVATALRALSVGGRALWDRHDNGDNLLFRETDLQAPAKSALFKELRELSDPQARTLVAELEKAVERKLEEVPAIDELLPETKPVSVSVPSGLKAGEPAVTPKRLAAASTAGVNPLAFEDDGAAQPKRERSVKRTGVPLSAWIAGGAAVAACMACVLVGGILWAVVGRGKDNAQVAQQKKGGADEVVAEKPLNKKPLVKELAPIDVKGPDKQPAIKRPPPVPMNPDKGQPVVPMPDVKPPVFGAFVPLFNGKDLTGWIQDPKFKDNWQVVNGNLTDQEAGRGALFTARDDYGDFHLRVEARLPAGASSGVLFRSTLNYHGYDARLTDQITGMLIISTQGEALNTSNQAQAGKAAAIGPGDWISLEVIAEGDRLRVKINGQTTTDHVDSKNNSRKGRIGLRGSRGKFEVRKIEIMEFKPAAPPIVAAGEFVPLFNGIDLAGWAATGQPEKWRVENGNLTVSATSAGRLFTVRDDFKDFHLRVEVRLKSGASSVYFRHLATGEYYEALFNSKLAGKLAIHPRAGSGQTAAVSGTTVAVAGEWNALEVIAEGNRLRVILNGQATTDYTDKNSTSMSGRIGLRPLDANAEIEFRKIEIKEFGPANIAAAPDPKRTRWVHSKGSFANTNEKEWVETDGEKVVFRFQESDRTDDYVELKRSPPNVVVRLYRDRSVITVNDKPFPGHQGAWEANKPVTLNITAIPDPPTRRYIEDAASKLLAGKVSVKSKTKDSLVMEIDSADDPAAIAPKITFGDVTSVQGRTITVTAKKLDLPLPDAAAVATALGDLKSTNKKRRIAGADQLAKAYIPLPDRQVEVAKALEDLATNKDIWVGKAALRALVVWARPENIPGVALAMDNNFTRREALEVLAQFKDATAAVAIAKLLPGLGDRAAAGAALKAMGPLAEKAVIPYLAHKDVFCVKEACNILKEIGTAECVPVLTKLANSNNNFVSPAARDTLTVVRARTKTP